MYRLRAVTAATVGMVQLSRRHHSGAFRSHQRRRVMLTALQVATGITAGAGLLWTRAYAEAGSSVKHDKQMQEEEAVDDLVAEGAESQNAIESSSGEEDEEAGTEGKKKKQRVGFRDRKHVLTLSSVPSVLCRSHFPCLHELSPILSH